MNSDDLLRELLTQSEHPATVVRLLGRWFNYVERYYVARHSLPHLQDVGMRCFHNDICSEPGLRDALKIAAMKLTKRDAEHDTATFHKQLEMLLQTLSIYE